MRHVVIRTVILYWLHTKIHALLYNNVCVSSIWYYWSTAGCVCVCAFAVASCVETDVGVWVWTSHRSLVKLFSSLFQFEFHAVWEPETAEVYKRLKLLGQGSADFFFFGGVKTTPLLCIKRTEFSHCLECCVGTLFVVQNRINLSVFPFASQEANHPQKLFKHGQCVSAKVVGINPKKPHELQLSFTGNLWESISLKEVVVMMMIIAVLLKRSTIILCSHAVTAKCRLTQIKLT